MQPELVEYLVLFLRGHSDSTSIFMPYVPVKFSADIR